MQDHKYNKEMDFNNFLQILEFKDIFYFNLFLDHPIENRIQYGQLKKGLLWGNWGFDLFSGKAKYPLFINISNRIFSKKEMFLEISGRIYDDDEDDRQMNVENPFTKKPEIIWAKEGCECKIRFLDTKKAQLFLVKIKDNKRYNYAVIVKDNHLELVLEDLNNQGTVFDVLFPPMTTYEEYITQQLINNYYLIKYFFEQQF